MLESCCNKAKIRRSNYYVRDNYCVIARNYHVRYNLSHKTMNYYGRDNMRIYDAADFGRAVRAFRKAKGYTQQQIADLSGCSLMFVSNLERGKETAELGKALAVLATIGVDIHADARDGAK